MKAVVMAGGEGSRLRPLTSRRPKPLVPVAGRPVMHHIVELLARHGITEVISTLHYLADEIESYFGDGTHFGVQMRYVVEDTPLGTAGAVKLAQDYIGQDDFLIISGDAMTDIDLTALIERHTREKNDVTIALQHVSNPLEFGVVITDENGRITRFLEKPSWGEVFSDTINTGIYVLRPGILDYMEWGKPYDFSKELFPRMLREGKRLGGYVIEDYWTDVGNLQQYQQANYDALEGEVRLAPYGSEIAPGIWAGSNCQIDPEAELVAPVRLGNGVRIGAGARIEGPAAIGDRSIVAGGAAIERAVIWEDVFIGAESTLRDCAILNRTVIKDHVNVSEGTVIGERCMVGSGADVRAHLKIWPDKTITSGSIVSMSLIYGIKWPGSLFGGVGVEGLANLELTPEFALKLGQAFGSFLRPGQLVMVSRDTHPVSRVMNRCIMAGLMATGVNVEELRSMPLPLSRFETRMRGDGGVYVRVSPNDPSSILVEFFDRDGINIDKATERKIENLFFREDFRRTSMEDVGRLDVSSRSLERYVSAFNDALAPKALPEAGFKVVIDYAYGNAALVLPRILSNLGVEMIALNAYFDDTLTLRAAENREKHLTQLVDIVRSLDADLGILVDHDGETFALVDDSGRIVDGDKLLALLTLVVARSYEHPSVALPVTAPQAIDHMAARYGASLVRTKSDRRTLMALAQKEGAKLSFAGSANYEVIFPEFHSAFDALYGAAKLLELLANEKCKLSELVDLLPDWHMAAREVACPWEHKGRIMRTIIDEERGKDVEMLDGVRIKREDGWVLVLPDSSDPAFRIIAEADTPQQALEYVDVMSEHIEELVAG